MRSCDTFTSSPSTKMKSFFRRTSIKEQRMYLARVLGLAIALILSIAASVLADDVPMIFVPTPVLEAFVATAVGREIVSGHIPEPKIVARYCGPSADTAADFIVIASSS